MHATAGLRGITIGVPTADLDEIAERLELAGIAHERSEGIVTTQDPWGNTRAIPGFLTGIPAHTAVTLQGDGWSVDVTLVTTTVSCNHEEVDATP